MSHAVFIWASYVVAFAGLGGLLIVSVAARRATRRELETRGLEKRR